MTEERTHEFMFNGLQVGCFEEAFPRSPGRYRYMPYRSGGHYEMHKQRRANGGARCYYDSGGTRVSFMVTDCPEYGVLELHDFETSPQP